ncbi:hypothetical protein HYU06_07365 [Candidatus Woesearchaeota archaeon]|nr:hypothetical protein [Candidatus Woesearchaeota archaeon]
MTYIKLKQGDFEPIFDKKFAEDNLVSPKLYFETIDKLYLFRPVGYVIYYTIIDVSSIQDLAAYKLQHFVNTYELPGLPNFDNRVNLVIRQE